jgi:GNAT superfamily N-acetyltransferase
MLRTGVPEVALPALRIRPLVEADLEEADRIMRLAFGTELGIARPEQFRGDAEMVRTRWLTEPSGALVAEHDGSVIGSSFANHWGSIGVLGPVSVHPDYWGRSVGSALVSSTVDIFARWEIPHVGLFTFANSPKHVALYQRFGFWPRSITVVMKAPVAARSADRARLVSALTPPDRAGAIAAVRSLTDAIHPGLDVSREIESLRAHALGETVMIDDDEGLAGAALCHMGPGTEAGSGNCYVKLAAARPGSGARGRFVALVDACHALAASRGASFLVAGINAAREEAWLTLRELGFRPFLQGVSMHRPNLPLYSTPDAFVIDDWR